MSAHEKDAALTGGMLWITAVMLAMANFVAVLDMTIANVSMASIAGGSGAAFSLIPAQNATGNWIKVVQRVPVRIALEPKELTAHPLRVGLSMTATIDTQKAD